MAIHFRPSIHSTKIRCTKMDGTPLLSCYLVTNLVVDNPSVVSYTQQYHVQKNEICWFNIISVHITVFYAFLQTCFACWVFFGSLVPAICNCTSCAQVHELPQSHCGDNREDTLFSLFSWLPIYHDYLASVRFEHSVCRRLFITTDNGPKEKTWCCAYTLFQQPPEKY